MSDAIALVMVKVDVFTPLYLLLLDKFTPFFLHVYPVALVALTLMVCTPVPAHITAGATIGVIVIVLQTLMFMTVVLNDAEQPLLYDIV